MVLRCLWINCRRRTEVVLRKRASLPLSTDSHPDNTNTTHLRLPPTRAPDSRFPGLPAPFGCRQLLACHAFCFTTLRAFRVLPGRGAGTEGHMARERRGPHRGGTI